MAAPVYNPFGSSGGSVYNPFATPGTPSASTYSPFPKVAKPKPLTVQQYIQMQDAKKSKHSGSFVSEIEHAGSSALHPVAWTFDKLLRPEYAVATATDKAISAARNGSSLSHVLEQGAHGASRGFQGKGDHGFGQVLQHQGVLKGHGTLRGIAGFGLDIAADPLTYVTGGADDIVAHSAEHAALIDAGRVAMHGEDSVDALKGAADTLAKGGENYTARHALAVSRLKQVTDPSLAAKGGLRDAQDATVAVNRAMAQAEEKSVEKFKPSIYVGSRALGKKVQITPTSIAGHNIPALPKLDNFIAHGGIGSKVAENFRDKFIRGHGETPISHAALITHKHLTEEAASTNLKLVRNALKGAPKLEHGEMLHALHIGETTKGIVLKRVLKDGTHQLNPIVMKRLEKTGVLSHDQATFLRKWHAATEQLSARDKSFGVSYQHWGEATGHVYVPHLVDKSGDALTDVQVGHLTKAGFQRSRAESPNLSMAHLADLHDQGLLGKGVETDPYKLLAHTARARATKQADNSLLNAYGSGVGISTRLVDEAKLLKNSTRQLGLGEAKELRQDSHDIAQGAQEAHRESYIQQAIEDHNSKMAEQDAKIRSIKYGRSSKKLKAKDDFWFDHHGYQHTLEGVNRRNVLNEEARQSALSEAERRFYEREDENVAAAAASGKHYEPEDFNPDNPDHIHPDLENQIEGRVTKIHNVHDEHGNVIGSMHYTETPTKMHVHTVFIRPDSRDATKGHFKELIRPIMESKKPIYAHVLNPRLHRLAERAGVDVSHIEKGFEEEGAKPIERGEAAHERLPRLVTAPNKTKAAQLANLNRGKSNLLASHVKMLDEIQKGVHEPLNKILAPHVAEQAKHAKVLTSMDRQMGNLQKEETHLLKGRPNPAYNAATHRSLADVPDQYGHAQAFPPEIADAIKRYKTVASGNDKAVTQFANTWRKWTANWKLAVTSVNPGYRIRNTMSDVWSMYLSGVPMPAIPIYAEKARRLMKAAKDGDPQAVRQMAEVYHEGILSGLYQGDVQNISKMLQYSGTKRSLAQEGRFIKLGTKVAQEANAHVENWGRLTHYLYRRDRLGESGIQAAAKVKEAHFDYEDLTPFEQKYMKQIMPFYTWSRKNIPFQVKKIVSSPGQFSAFPKLEEESEQSAGGDKGNIVPSYIADNFGFQVPFGKHNYYLPQIGATDLQVFDSKGGALQRATGLANPALRLPFELMANKNFSTGQPIKSDTHGRNPVSGLGADLLRLIPGSNVGLTSRKGPNGKELMGQGANPYYQYLLGQLPMARELGISSSGIQRNKTPIPPELSYLGGQSVQHIDPAEQREIAQIDLSNKVKSQVAELRDEGRLPRAKVPKKSKNAQRIANTLNLRSGRQ